MFGNSTGLNVTSTHHHFNLFGVNHSHYYIENETRWTLNRLNRNLSVDSRLDLAAWPTFVPDDEDELTALQENVVIMAETMRKSTFYREYHSNTSSTRYGVPVSFSVFSFVVFSCWKRKKKRNQELQDNPQTGETPADPVVEPSERPPSYVEVVEPNYPPPPTYNVATRNVTNNHITETRWRFYDSWSARRDRMRTGRTAKLGSRDSSVAVVHINEPPTVHGEREQCDTGTQNSGQKPRTAAEDVGLSRI